MMRGEGVARTLLERQVALGMCAGLRASAMAALLCRPEGGVNRAIGRLLARSGMSDAEEFCVQQNAYIREKIREGPVVIVVHAGPSWPGARGVWKRGRMGAQV